MRKKFGAFIFILFILGGVFSPVFGIEKVEADSQALNDVFPKDQNWPGGRVMQANLKLKNGQTNSNGALFYIDVNLDGPVEEITPKDTNGNDELDAGDDPGCSFDCDKFGGWDSIFDNDVYNTGENGIFLVIGKAKIQIEIIGYPNLLEVVSESVDFTVFDPNQNQGNIPTKYISEDINKAVNIGYYIAKAEGLYNDSQENFDGNAQIQNIQIPVGGLEAGQTYYAQIYLVEDAGESIGNSNIVSFQTLGASDPGAIEPLEYTNTSTGTFTDNQQKALFGEILDCGWDNWTGCFLELYYNTLYYLSHFLVGIVGGLFDFFVGFSLSNRIYDYNVVTFIGDGWRIVRDLSNIFFIFILLYAAIGLILKLHHFDAKGIIAKVIIIGLLVNFSMFFTRIVIDTSNILARVFYNEINIKTQPAHVGNEKNTGIKTQSLSAGIREGIAIEKTVSRESYDTLIKNGGVSMSAMFLIITIGIIVNIIFAWTLLTTSMYFIGRILGLWFAMIFAPLAFVTNIVPSLGSKLPQVGWKDWIKNLTDLAIMAPIFVFFMFIIISFLQSSFISSMLQSSNKNATVTEFLISLVLQFMLVIGLVQTAKSVTKKLSGQFGESVAGIAGGIAKFAGGAALGLGMGAVAMGSSRIFGGRAAKYLSSKEGKEMKLAAAGDEKAIASLKASGKYAGWDERKIQKMAEKKVASKQKIASASFDLRNTGFGNMITRTTGVDLNAVATLPGMKSFGVDRTVGGFQGEVDRRAAKRKKFFDNLSLSEDEKKDLEKQIKEKKEDLDRKKNKFEDKIKALERENNQIVQRKQAGTSLATDPATLASNQNKINELNTNMGKMIDYYKNGGTGTYNDHNGVTQTVNIDPNKDAIKKMEADYKEAEKGAFRKYSEFVQRYNADGTNNASLGSDSIWNKGVRGGLIQFTKNLKYAIREGIGGALVGSIAGPAGTFVGGLAGALTALNMGGIGKLTGRILDTQINEAASHAIEHGHVHEPHDKPVYKSPNINIFNMFKGLKLDSGGGGGGSNHGVGHDDHGGGGHH